MAYLSVLAKHPIYMRDELARQGYRAAHLHAQELTQVRVPVLAMGDNCESTPDCECACPAIWHIDTMRDYDIWTGKAKPIYTCVNCTACRDYNPATQAASVAVPATQLQFGLAAVNGAVALFALSGSMLSALFRLLYGDSVIGQVQAPIGTVEFGAFTHGS